MLWSTSVKVVWKVAAGLFPSLVEVVLHGYIHVRPRICSANKVGDCVHPGCHYVVLEHH